MVPHDFSYFHRCEAPLDMFSASVIMQADVAILKRYLGEVAKGSAGKVIVGTVKSDLHDIEKYLVVMMLGGAIRSRW
jgi:methanogenic corrinoid protein MtbC1